MRRLGWMIAVWALFVSTGCASGPGGFAICTAENSPGAICGLMNPEDLDLLPGGDWVIVSQMAQHGPEGDLSAPPARAGNLLAVHATEGTRRTIYPATNGWPLDDESLRSGSESWGHPDCSGTPNVAYFQPHGVAVGRHPSGVAMLAVVNHGAREAVELFAIDMDGEPSVDWRGCVPMPEGMMANDLALLSDGGFVVTKFVRPIEGMGISAIWSGLKIAAGWDTGAVYRWTPGKDVALVEGSGGSAPNGIAVSPDEKTAYVAEWGEDRIYRIALAPGGPLEWSSVELDHSPDNLTWTPDGKLLVAGQAGGVVTLMGCRDAPGVGCAVDYGIYLLDPARFEAKLIRTGKGAASVALTVGDELWIGPFTGDKIERVKPTE